MTKKITADTMIPLSFLFTLAAGILGLGVMYADLSNATARVKSLTETQSQIDRRLSTIEGKIDLLLKRGP